MMSSDMQKQKIKRDEKKKHLINQVMFIPIVCLLAIIPLIVRMVYVQPKDIRVYSLFNKVKLDDYYSQYKAVGIIIVSVVMVIMTYLFVEKNEIKMDKYSKIAYICGGGIIFMSSLSTMASDYKEVSIWGVYDRAEGLVIWTCYILMLLYTFYIVKDVKGYKCIIISLAFLIIVTAILGAFQYAGNDLLVKTKFGQNLIIPKEYRKVAGNLSSDYDSHKVLGTLFHYDYVGSFGAMVVPMFIVLTIMAKGTREKVMLGIVSLAALFVLFGSTSRAGLVGLGMAIIAGCIIFSRKLFSSWKRTLSIGGILIVILIGLNIVTKGSIFERIPTLFEDAVTLLTPSDKDFDYKNYIPVRAINEDNGSIIFELQDNVLKITCRNNELVMADGQEQVVQYSAERSEYTNEDGSIGKTVYYTTDDERYSNIKILRQDINVFTKQEMIDGMMININDSGFFNFEIEDSTIYAINGFSGERIHYRDAHSIGFKGKEKIGSARGYIWSRAIYSFLHENLLIGNGPDTSVTRFSEEDILAKWWAYGVTNVIVDKPHNLYLQIGMNQGGIALIAFLVLVISYLIQSLKLYSFKVHYSGIEEGMGIGIMLAIIGYLGAGFFNDSIVSVAPIFWILLGTGMAVNYVVTQTRR